MELAASLVQRGKEREEEDGTEDGGGIQVLRITVPPFISWGWYFTRGRSVNFIEFGGCSVVHVHLQIQSHA